MTIVNAIVEGVVDEAVASRVIAYCGHDIGTVYGKKGIAYVVTKVPKFNQITSEAIYLVLADFMDLSKNGITSPCPGGAITEWLPARNPNLIARLVVREIESWILADRDGIADFLKVDITSVPQAPESLPNPKEVLISLARRSRSRQVRDALVPAQGSTAVTGPSYTFDIIQFIRDDWNIDQAKALAPSLQACLNKIKTL